MERPYWMIAAAAAGIAIVWTESPWWIVVSALVPALLYAAVVAALARRSNYSLIAMAFLVGVIVAPAAASLNQGAANVVDLDRARALVAPVLEEAIKLTGVAVVLALALGRHDKRRAVLSGAALGIGFSATENISHFTFAVIQSGTTGLWLSLYFRSLLGGMAHAIFTATSALGFASARAAPLWLTLGAACLQHILWNALAAPAIADALCDAASANASCSSIPPTEALLLISPAIAAAALAPGFLVLHRATRRPRQ